MIQKLSVQDGKNIPHEHYVSLALPHTHTEAQLYWCQTKRDSNANNIFHLKEQNFMMIKVSLLKEDIMILDLYAPTKAQNTWRKTKRKKDTAPNG